MKTAITKLEPLFNLKTDKTRKIIQWDDDNAYGQRCIWLTEKSVTASSCIDLFSKFLMGDGWRDRAFGTSIVGPNGMTGDELGEAVFTQYAKHRGYAILVGLNGLLEHSSYQVMPLHRIRKGDQDRVGYFGVHEHWGLTGKKFQPKDIEWFPPYTEDQNKIMGYIEEAGSFEKFKGMILYFSIDPLNYPTPIYASALNDVETEARIGKFQMRNASTGFMASHIFKFSEEMDETESSQMEEYLKEFQGSDEAMKIMMIDGVGDDPENGQTLTVDKVDIQDVDRLFELTEESVMEKIRKSFLIPRALIGHEENTGFDTERIQQSRQYYNEIVKPDRNKAVKPLMRLVDNFEKPIKTNGDWEVLELYQNGSNSEI